MQNTTPTKLFAFKLADQRDQKVEPAQQWKLRDGISVAGCTWYDRENYEQRATSEWGEYDMGLFC